MNCSVDLFRFIPASGTAEPQAWAASKAAAEAPEQWGAAGGAALSREEILHAARYQFDIWGGGYNWLQGNALSARDIEDYIENTILPFYNDGKKVEVQGGEAAPNRIQRHKPLRPAAEQVIIVTHSMGGLVARALTEIQGYGKVLGVVHGVQPAAGAPDTYKRMRAGADGIEQLFLGRNAADLTAILSQAQGGMELLPTADYNHGKPWLKARDKAVAEEWDTGEGLALPMNGDPYKEIYKSPEWYGLVPRANEALMNPGSPEKSWQTGSGDMSGDDNSREALNDLIDKVKDFHDAIRGKYKNPTYVFYGDQGKRGDTGKRGGLFNTGLLADDDRFAFGQVVWEGPGGGRVGPKTVLMSDDQNGRIELVDGTRLRIAQADAPGDGTVPRQSGSAPAGQAGVEMVFTHGQSGPGSHNEQFGYDHQDACNDERALYATLYDIIKIAQNAHWHENKEESA